MTSTVSPPFDRAIKYIFGAHRTSQAVLAVAWVNKKRRGAAAREQVGQAQRDSMGGARTGHEYMPFTVKEQLGSFNKTEVKLGDDCKDCFAFAFNNI